jgi:hypothetical protein
MTWAIVWLYALGAGFWTGCALLYGLRSPWFHSSTGRVMLMTFTSLSAVLVLATVFRFVHPPLWLAVPLALAVLAAVDLAGLVQLINVWRLQRRDRARTSEEARP